MTVATTQGVPDTTPITLGGWLKVARERAGMKQSETALAIGVSRPLVSRWEHGDSHPDINEFRRMVELYDAPWLWEIAATSSAWYAQPLFDINTQCALTAVG